MNGFVAYNSVPETASYHLQPGARPKF